MAAKSRRVYGCFGVWKRASIEADSATSPAYMTAGAVADLGDDGQVVGDEDEREVEVGRERHEELEDLRLHHHVEGGRRLVGEENLRLAGERHGDRRSLPHPARELVREPVRPVLGDAHALEQLLRLPAGEPALGDVVQLHRLLDLRADGLNRVEGVHRALEDHRDVVPTVGLTVSSPRARMFSPSSRTSPATVALGGQEAHDREHRCRLSAAGFADEPEALARLELEAHPRTACSSPPPGSSNQTFRSSTCEERRRHSASSFPRRASP